MLKEQDDFGQFCRVLYFDEWTSDTHQSFSWVRWYGSAVPGFSFLPNASVSVKVPFGVRVDPSLWIPMPPEPSHAGYGPSTTAQVPSDLFCQARRVPVVAPEDEAVTVTICVAFPMLTGIPKSGGGGLTGRVVGAGFGALGAGFGVVFDVVAGGGEGALRVVTGGFAVLRGGFALRLVVTGLGDATARGDVAAAAGLELLTLDLPVVGPVEGLIRVVVEVAVTVDVVTDALVERDSNVALEGEPAADERFSVPSTLEDGCASAGTVTGAVEGPVTNDPVPGPVCAASAAVRPAAISPPLLWVPPGSATMIAARTATAASTDSTPRLRTGPTGPP